MSDTESHATDAARLSTLRPVLTWFAQAVGGRPTTLRDERDGLATDTPEPTRGARTIRLPSTIDRFASARENRGAYRIAVLRQALAGDPPASAAPSSRLWQRVFRLLEQMRVDAFIAQAYPGARTDLARVCADALAQRAPWPAWHTPLSRTLEALRRHALGAPPAALTGATSIAALAAMLAQADAVRRADATAGDSARAADAIVGALGVPVHRVHALRTRLAPTNGLPTETKRDGPVATPPARTAGGDDAADPAQLAPAQTPAARVWRSVLARRGASRAVPRPVAAMDDTRAEAAPSPRSGAAAPSPAADSDEGQVFAIDEWHWREQKLLPGWCTLRQRALRGDDALFIRRARSRHAALVRAVHRRFAAWRPEGLQRVHGADDGDEIEFDRVIEAMVDRRAGLLHDRPLYVRRDRALRDVATAFLVDTSASTDFVLHSAHRAAPRAVPGTDADTAFLYDLSAGPPAAAPPKRQVIDVAKDALALMCDALHALGDAFAIYTFSGHGRAHVDFRIVKGFDERVSARTAGALAAMHPHGATRTGAAVRHASALLAHAPQRRRTLIVVTDGYPEDIDYGPEPRELRYGLEDTAHALLEAQAMGIATFCLSIDPAGHDYLRRMCPPNQYMVIGEVQALPEQLSKVYQAMTRAAND